MLVLLNIFAFSTYPFKEIIIKYLQLYFLPLSFSNFNNSSTISGLPKGLIVFFACIIQTVLLGLSGLDSIISAPPSWEPPFIVAIYPFPSNKNAKYSSNTLPFISLSIKLSFFFIKSIFFSYVNSFNSFNIFLIFLIFFIFYVLLLNAANYILNINYNS